MPQRVTLKLANDDGTPVAYPGTEQAYEVALVEDLAPVWIGVSEDGTTNAAFPISTPLATIRLTYPRVYQGVQFTYQGLTIVAFNGELDYEHRVAACCLSRADDSASDSGSASASGSESPPDGFQMRFTLQVGDEDLSTDIGITFGVTPSNLTGFVDWGEGDGEEEFFNSDNDMEMHHTYSAAGNYLVRIRFSEPIDTVISFGALYTMADVPMSNFEVNEAFTGLTAIGLDNNDLQVVDIENLPALDTLTITGNQLTSAAVDDILVTLDANGVINGSVDLSGQSPSAAPGAAGIAAKASLEGKGWVVTTD